MKNLVVYGRKNPFCPFCEKAEKTLQSRNIPYTYVDVTEDQESFQKLVDLGLRGVPQLFLDDVHIGDSGVAESVTINPERQVRKRDGRLEPFTPSKINSMAEWGVKNTSKVQWSEIVMKAMSKLDGDIIDAADIQMALIKACIDKETPHHDKVAGRLMLGEVRNTSFATTEFHWAFLEFYEYMVDNNYWRGMEYTEEQLLLLESRIDHDRDLEYSHISIRQFRDKYGLKSKGGCLLELPQFMYMGIAMSTKEGYPLEEVISYYDAISLHKINLPSPTLSTVRTPTNAGVSCCVISAGDDLQSIESAKHAAFMFTANSAGIGIEYSVRSPKDDVRNGYAKAGGKLPHYRVVEAIVDEVKQANRGGSATMSIVPFDPEIVTLLKLKLPRTPDERKIDGLDYSFLTNDSLLRRAAKKQDWALVSRVDSPELYEAFYSAESDRFEAIMDDILKDDTFKKQVISAYELVSLIFLESRQEIGRYYQANIQHMNDHTPFDTTKHPIKQSNLCLEIALPTNPYSHITNLYKDTYDYNDGTIALCFLSAIDVMRTEEEEMEEIYYLTLSSIDDTITNMSYPFPQVKASANAWRTAGVGITNLAQKIASEGKSYNDTQYIHDIAEAHYYYLLKASIRLAKERGKFPMFKETKWAKGWLPIDTYNKNVDTVAKTSGKFDWESLRKDVLTYGVRFATLAAHMPCESSSGMTGSTNGVYPVRYSVVYKNSQEGTIPFFAPNLDMYSYESAFDLETKSITNMYAVIQKWTDQTISADTYEDFDKYPNRKVPVSLRFRNYLYWNKMGIKTQYYQNFRTNRGTHKVVEDTQGSCVSCKF